MELVELEIEKIFSRIHRLQFGITYATIFNEGPFIASFSSMYREGNVPVQWVVFVNSVELVPISRVPLLVTKVPLLVTKVVEKDGSRPFFLLYFDIHR